MFGTKKTAVLCGVAALAFTGLVAPASFADEAPAPGTSAQVRLLNVGQAQRLDSNHTSDDQPNAIVWAPNNITPAQV
ncbi:hypothetical protein GCM10010497_59250 [Streptomyces cinereoruber]|uniref:Uncharacterized protein n=1 Tax=Streptomyces cinereoruber TaxID=67260 RepID=A0AAV4KSU6_9ACTN|nr:hypothetical protein [Streptomyces cinereoruber]MBB4161729.1 hypothetical protein [Streptomyces cinereoruber]MBY8820045.1 hypothetical protein [Streptomyces cinereoruber]NIH65414.1 hypothetical protein [Streptomyces cinereoruber]QEV30859.1 hypothetical protein CP977_00430 [Streptomyces cinereoruber]GGR48032.1 hypothetical protein GCM10010497_59250 [Streptomyces cinereoruber]